jgi:serine/threonine protein kinase
MVKDRASVSQQTDIFALGCTLSEVITGQRLFPCDYDVFQYMYTDRLPQRPAIAVDERSKVYISELVRGMLELDWRKRPSTVHILNEIGDPEVNWRELLIKRAEEYEYPHETSPSWRKMVSKSYWYVC